MLICALCKACDQLQLEWTKEMIAPLASVFEAKLVRNLDGKDAPPQVQRAVRLADSDLLSCEHGQAEDYAWSIAACLALDQVLGDSSCWVERAQHLQKAFDERFWDDEIRAYRTTSDPSVPLSTPLCYDDERPYVGAVAMTNLARLASVSPEETAERYQARHDLLAHSHNRVIQNAPLSSPALVGAIVNSSELKSSEH